MKTVIFIAGTSYSGSTYIDMILANDPEGFSAGEVKSLFYPHRPNHFKVINSIEDNPNHIWHGIYKDGAENLYKNIFKHHPDKTFITDSCKSPVWIYKQRKKLKKQGINSKVLLIWKTPEELYKSYLKRSVHDNYDLSWFKYHKQFTYYVDNYIAIPYSDFKNEEKPTLKKICIALGINYFDGKEKYWEKDQETLFGNVSARVKLNPASFNSAHHLQKKIKSINNNLSNEAVIKEIEQFNLRTEKDKEIELIEQLKGNIIHQSSNKSIFHNSVKNMKASIFYELFVKKRISIGRKYERVRSEKQI